MIQRQVGGWIQENEPYSVEGEYMRSLHTWKSQCQRALRSSLAFAHRIAVGEKVSWWYCEYQPCVNGGHTTFELSQQRNTKNVVPRPLDNYRLVTEEQKEHLRRMVNAAGLTLVE